MAENFGFFVPKPQKSAASGGIAHFHLHQPLKLPFLRILYLYRSSFRDRLYRCTTNGNGCGAFIRGDGEGRIVQNGIDEEVHLGIDVVVVDLNGELLTFGIAFACFIFFIKLLRLIKIL